MPIWNLRHLVPVEASSIEGALFVQGDSRWIEVNDVDVCKNLGILFCCQNITIFLWVDQWNDADDADDDGGGDDDGKCVDEEPCFIASHGHFESQLTVWGVKIFVESFVMA